MRRRDCLKIGAVSLTGLLAVAGCLEPGEGGEGGEEEDGGGEEGEEGGGAYNREGEEGGEDGSGDEGNEGGGEKMDPPFDSSR